MRTTKGSVNFEIGFDHGLEGHDYRCPSVGNRLAESDYALGYECGDVARKMKEKQ